LIALLSLLFSLPYVYLLAEEPASDLREYEEVAINMLDGRGYVHGEVFRAYRTPGLVLFLMPIYAIWGVRNYFVLRVIQSAMLALMNVYVYRIGCRLGGARLGVLAGLLAAASHEFVFWAAKPATEFLYTFCLVCGIWAMLRTVDRRSGWWAAAAGFWSGAAFLTRPVPLAVVLWWGVGLVWVLRRAALPATDGTNATPVPETAPLGHNPRGRGLRLAVTFAGAFSALLLPWLVRNYLLYHRVFINSNSGITIWWANHPSAVVGGWYGFSWPAPAPLTRIQQMGFNEVEVSDQLTAEAIGFIRANPGRFVRLAIGRIGYMLLGTKVMLTNVPYDRLYYWPGFELELIKWNWPLLVLAVFGLCTTVWRREPLWWVLAAVIFGSFAVHLVYTSVPRMRVPLLPALFLYAVRGLWVILDGYVQVPRRAA
jgi:hypothetical protein